MHESIIPPHLLRESHYKISRPVCHVTCQNTTLGTSMRVIQSATNTVTTTTLACSLIYTPMEMEGVDGFGNYLNPYSTVESRPGPLTIHTCKSREKVIRDRM